MQPSRHTASDIVHTVYIVCTRISVMSQSRDTKAGHNGEYVHGRVALQIVLFWVFLFFFVLSYVDQGMGR